MIERLVNGRRHYAWLIVGVTFVTLITTAGFRATPGVLIVPLQNHFGWSRGTISLAVVFPIVALFVRDRPQSVGLQPYGAPEPVAVPERPAKPFRPAIDGLLIGVKSQTFWLLVATFFVCGLSTNGLIGTHLIPAAV